MYYIISEKGYIGAQAGIGYKGKKMYICYSDKYIKDWAKSWDNAATPELFGYKVLPSNFQFDHYINFETGEMQ